MMMHLHTYGPAFLELTFILVALLLLHSLRQVIGLGAFFLALGSVMVFAQVLTAVGLRVVGGVEGLQISIGSTIFYTPFLAVLLIVYIVDGTQEAQRLIWALMAMVGIFLYLTFLTEQQISLAMPVVLGDRPEAILSSELSPAAVRGIFISARSFMLASLLSILVEFITLPVIYEILRSRNCRLGVSVFGALIFAQVLDAFFFELVVHPGAENWWDGLRATYLARVGVLVWAGCLTVVYLRLRDAPSTHASSERRPLDFLVAFLGAYGQTQRLQANLREWEGRYRMVVESTNDLIFLVAESGLLLDANRMARQRTGYGTDELMHLSLRTLLTQSDGQPIDWREIWLSVFSAGNAALSVSDTHQRRVPRAEVYEWRLRAKNDSVMEVEVTVTPLYLQTSYGVLLVVRDVSQRKRLERERTELEGQLLHAHRMEAVGRVAGGVAHDFNNLLHAIRGSLDSLERHSLRDEKVRQTLSVIGNATDRAARLTGQLLAFARGGKYHVETLRVAQLVTEAEMLFKSMLGKKATLKMAVHPDPMMVDGDENQLQQVLLNMLINARDSLPEGVGTIVLRAEPATEHTPGWTTGQRTSPASSYVVIRIRDNGSGIDPETLKRIFEPFFTTKDKGTGMGLAMAYGCIQNHHGWIHVVSELGKGTEFFLYLPRARTTPDGGAPTPTVLSASGRFPVATLPPGYVPGSSSSAPPSAGPGK